jgi:hypothetical protein
MRFVLEAAAGALGGLLGWFVVGFLAAQLFTSIGGGREGANAMGGFFFVGPVGGIAGFAIAFWLARRALEGGGAAQPSSSAFASMAIALGVVLALGAAVIVALAAIRKPEATVNIRGREAASIEFEIFAPDAALGGRRPEEVISLSFYAADGHDERIEPVSWAANPGRGGVTLTGRVAIRERTREQYFLISVKGDEFKLYAEIPENMYRKGHWIPRLYLGRDESTPPEDLVRATCRYLPPPK